MAKSLILAEKPSVGRDIARVLKCNKKGKGYLEGDRYIVTWALGHLVTLADPEKYNHKYQNWELEDLPIIPKDMKLEVIKQSRGQYNNVKTQMLRKDVDEIIIATDAGREGELVARWIIEKARINKPMKRLWISSVTDKAIKQGFNRLKPAKEFENLYRAAVARSKADWVVGINATRALTCKYNAQLSCGRVQTPTLAIIAQREDEIKNFKSREFYGIDIIANGVKFKWQDKKSGQTNSFDKNKIDEIYNKLDKNKIDIVDVSNSKKKTYPPMLYDLTELQRDANKLFNYSAKETLSIMQSLYERHKVLTYPRTDSRYLTTDIVDTLQERLSAIRVGPYSKLAVKAMKINLKGKPRFVDNSKVSDHHAIIPTEESPNLRDFTDKERKIYDLVVKRFLANLYNEMEYMQTTIKAQNKEELFIAKGKTIINLGWQEVYDNKFSSESEEDNQSLPGLSKQDIIKIDNISISKGSTKPPSLFNEASLLSAMENPSKYMETKDKSLAKTIDQAGGLGTVATRADIIDKLFNTFLIEKRGKDITITSKGKQLLDLVPDNLKSPDLTAKWERNLSQIEKGQLDSREFVKSMEEYSKEVVKDIKRSNKKFKHDNITTTRCDKCNKFMLEVNTKHGKVFVCQDRECGNRKNISKTTNARCPVCRKRLELRGEGDGQIFVCICGHREKLSSFNARKKKENNRLSKKDVSRYLKKQDKKDEGFASPFDDIFSKLDI